MQTIQVVLLSLANAAIAFTITEAKIFLPLRERAKAVGRWIGELFSCGYCLGFWSAFALTVICRPHLFAVWPPLDLFLTSFVIAWLSAFQWVTLCWLMRITGK